jgi:hypothetical protein
MQNPDVKGGSTRNLKDTTEDYGYMQFLRLRGSLRESWEHTPASGGSRWPASKEFLKIMLDGLAQKTPLLRRSRTVFPLKYMRR